MRPQGLGVHVYCTAGICEGYGADPYIIFLRNLKLFCQNMSLKIQVCLSQCSLCHNFRNLHGLHCVSFFSRTTGCVSDLSQTVLLINRNVS
jgi:hypothetical protein